MEAMMRAATPSRGSDDEVGRGEMEMEMEMEMRRIEGMRVVGTADSIANTLLYQPQHAWGRGAAIGRSPLAEARLAERADPSPSLIVITHRPLLLLASIRPGTSGAIVT
jgi:hypothetical protein